VLGGVFLVVIGGGKPSMPIADTLAKRPLLAWFTVIVAALPSYFGRGAPIGEPNGCGNPRTPSRRPVGRYPRGRAGDPGHLISLPRGRSSLARSLLGDYGADITVQLEGFLPAHEPFSIPRAPVRSNLY